jgi:hypothetical protein
VRAGQAASTAGGKDSTRGPNSAGVDTKLGEVQAAGHVALLLHRQSLLLLLVVLLLEAEHRLLLLLLQVLLLVRS